MITPPTVCTVELVDDAVLRRADVDALELVLGRDLALDELGDLALDLAQLLARPRVRRSWSICRICSSISVILPLACAVAAMSWPALALEPRGVALERRHALDRDEVLAPQLAHAFELLADQLDLALLGRDLARRGPGSPP